MMVTTNAINIALDLIFVVVLGMRVDGVALDTQVFIHAPPPPPPP